MRWKTLSLEASDGVGERTRCPRGSSFPVGGTRGQKASKIEDSSEHGKRCTDELTMAAMLAPYVATATTMTIFLPATSTSHRPRSLSSAGNRSKVPSRARAQIPAPAAAAATNGRDDNIRTGGGHPPAVSPGSLSPGPTMPMGKRRCLAAAAGFLAAVSLGTVRGPVSKAAVLEADDDVELLEKVKKDRTKRLERQGVINSSGKETGYLQELVYKLNRVGEAIENNDLSAAGTILGANANADWVRNVNAAFAKLSSSREEKTAVDTFNTSLVSLISSVSKKDAESSKVAFFASASALEKWVTLTGLVGELSGL